MTIVGLIPARAGSKRIPHKNMKRLGGKPLIQWTIDAANASGIFDHLVVSSEDDATLEYVSACEHVIPLKRPAEFATDASPDIQWVQHAMALETADAFAILRPTSPFRTADTIRRAFRDFRSKPCDSIRAVEWVRQHPYKMWAVTDDGRMHPAFSGCNEYQPLEIVPWHSCPTQSLPSFYVQNASLEMAWRNVPMGMNSIAGYIVRPFFTEGIEGFDVNTPEDWALAEQIIQPALSPIVMKPQGILPEGW